MTNYTILLSGDVKWNPGPRAITSTCGGFDNLLNSGLNMLDLRLLDVGEGGGCFKSVIP